jgi:hypothetical protein
MSYNVLIKVTDCETGKPLQGAIVTDGTTVSTTDKNGQVNFEVVGTDDDPDPGDRVQISATNYGPQSALLGSNVPEVGICLQPYTVPPPPPQPTKPVVKLDSNEPATLTGDGTIAISWVSSQYDKFLIWWTVNGEAADQGEVDTPGTSGSWTTNQSKDTLIPGAVYTFMVEGGVYAGLSGYNYSGWGNTITVTAVQNLRSLVQFLEHSGINPAGLRVSSIMGGQTSLKRVMKLA